jgi:hypothetical protein
MEISSLCSPSTGNGRVYGKRIEINGVGKIESMQKLCEDAEIQYWSWKTV